LTTRSRLLACTGAALLAVGAPLGLRGGGGVLHAQDLTCDRGDLEVAALRFSGNTAFADAVLEAGIVTTQSSWARRRLGFIGRSRCLDRAQFALDVARLTVFYRNHGYVDATVDTVVTALSASRVAVEFRVAEGEPVRISALAIEGLERVPEREQVMGGLSAAVGQPFDKYAIEAARDSLSRRLRNTGYPDAEVFVGYDTEVAAHRASLIFSVHPGARATIGPVRVVAAPRAGGARGIGDATVRRVAGVTEGDLYSEERLERAKRSLYQTEAYDQVSVRTDSGPTRGDSSRIGVTLDLVEGYMRTMRTAAGYGTLDCFRATGDLTQYNAFGGAARLDLRSRVSKLGISAPLSGLDALCPQAKADDYSRDLNYYGGASVSRGALAGGFVPSVTLYSERRSEYRAFLRTIPVGGTVTFARSRGGVGALLGYSVEYGRTEAQPALLCAVFNACEAADRSSLQRTQQLAVASVAWTRETGDNLLNPTRGSVLRAEFRTAGRHTGSDPALQFNRVLLDGTRYLALGPDVTLAARLRLGAVVGPSLSLGKAALFVPPQERLFAGGPTTVRGFSQNELGPAVYIAASYDTVRANGLPGGTPSNPADTVFLRARSDEPGERTVPTGGNALVVANIEARFRSPVLPDLLQWTAFVDAGEVWNRGTTGTRLGSRALRWTPGLGVRARSVIGFIRLDLAYNAYQRPSGAAYFDAPVAVGGALLCVSPGNALRVTAGSDGRLAQAAGDCPATFAPPRSAAFIRRLTPSISIGQAF